MLLALVMTLGMFAIPTLAAGPAETQAVTYMESGRTGVAKLTLSQLRTLYNAIPDCPSDIYAKKPVTSGSGYAPATLSAAALKHAESFVNYYRASVGVGPVSFTAEANASSAMGALTLAMSGEFSHYPSKPAAMSEADYQKGLYATSHSNISASWGYPTYAVLGVAISGQMEDSDSSNVDRLGHRRWLLNPNTTTLGIGTANADNAYYTDVAVFGDYVKSTQVSDYRFIAWPASGFNLTETFPSDTPWSVTLNPREYQAPAYGSVTVTLVHDNKTWTFNSKTPNAPASNKDFFTVDNNGYGVSNCIIFRPAFASLPDYLGEYTVKITGLKDRNGNAAEINYKVTFAEAEGSCTHKNVELQGKVDATCTEAGYTGDKVCVDCGEVMSKGKTVSALGHAWDNGTIIEEATDEAEGTKRFTCTRCGETRTAKYHNCPTENYIDRVGDSNWAHAGIDYCVERGMMGSVSTGALVFSPKTSLTRAQIATVIWRLESSPEASAAAEFADLKPGAWYMPAVNWAVEVGLMNGTTETAFEPNLPVSREMLVTVMFRYCGMVLGVSTDARGDISGFPDVDRVHSYATDAMAWAVAEGIIGGVAKNGGEYLDPRETATRAQTAVIFARFCQKYGV